MYGLGDDIQELIKERDELRLENQRLRNQINKFESDAQKVASQLLGLASEIREIRVLSEAASSYKLFLEQENKVLKAQLEAIRTNQPVITARQQPTCGLS